MLHLTELFCTLLDARIPMLVAMASMLMPSYVNLQQKGDGLGVFNFVTKHH
jgi:hypothetical protein